MKWLCCFVLTCGVLFSVAPQKLDAETILEGRLSQKELASRYAWFEEGKQKYVPDESTVKALLPYSRHLRFIVVMGTWCSDSRMHVPPFFKLMGALHIPEKRIELIGVDRKKQSSKVDLPALHVGYVPTFVVLYQGKEVGRIVENPEVSLEQDLLQILRNTPASGDRRLTSTSDPASE
jgi:hypothetical protein